MISYNMKLVLIVIVLLAVIFYYLNFSKKLRSKGRHKEANVELSGFLAGITFVVILHYFLGDKIPFGTSGLTFVLVTYLWRYAFLKRFIL